jgi:hypothetical protein
MRLDTKQALRPVLRLPNPSRMQAARWGEARLDTKQALRLVLCLTNPRRMQAATRITVQAMLATSKFSQLCRPGEGRGPICVTHHLLTKPGYRYSPAGHDFGKFPIRKHQHWRASQTESASGTAPALVFAYRNVTESLAMAGITGRKCREKRTSVGVENILEMEVRGVQRVAMKMSTRH